MNDYYINQLGKEVLETNEVDSRSYSQTYTESNAKPLIPAIRLLNLGFLIFGIFL